MKLWKLSGFCIEKTLLNQKLTQHSDWESPYFTVLFATLVNLVFSNYVLIFRIVKILTFPIFEKKKITKKITYHFSANSFSPWLISVETLQVPILNNFPVLYTVGLYKDKLQEWMEHWSTDIWNSETSRDNQKIIWTTFEHLKKSINFQN